jgi:hypothetical protein
VCDRSVQVILHIFLRLISTTGCLNIILSTQKMESKINKYQNWMSHKVSQNTVNSQSSICRLFDLWIIFAQLCAQHIFYKTQTHVYWAIDIFTCPVLKGGGLVLGGSTEHVVKQYFFPVLYCQYWWWGR